MSKKKLASIITSQWLTWQRSEDSGDERRGRCFLGPWEVASVCGRVFSPIPGPRPGLGAWWETLRCGPERGVGKASDPVTCQPLWHPSPSDSPRGARPDGVACFQRQLWVGAPGRAPVPTPHKSALSLLHIAVHLLQATRRENGSICSLQGHK